MSQVRAEESSRGSLPMSEQLRYSSESSVEMGERAAAQIEITPKPIAYIEARGYLCHELLFLLGGHIEYVKTPWKEFVLKILESLFPISPICRWFPTDGVLEWVGSHDEDDRRVYRLTPKEGPIVVFFVKYKPEPPAFGFYIHHLFMVPQLDISYFLRPPFDESNEQLKIKQLLRSGSVGKLGPPLPMTEDGRKAFSETWMDMCRGLWQGFTKK
jgi:hypothetical protein